MDRCDSTENPCPVCHDSIQIYAIGPCDHPVCYKCSTRMRVLCEQMDCPICRSAMPQVAFVYDKTLFTELNLRDCIPNRKSKIFYECEEIEDKYLDLLEFRCRQCPKRKAERTFAQLQTHMRRDHQLFACDICIVNLKIFPYETKFYDRKSLAVHRRMGDEDDKAYKGHPLCEFCDTRYLDKDELMKHLRKDHFFCHFCDQEGSNAYYNDYPDLFVHFGENHYLCTEDECGNPATRFTHAFSSEIDLKSHKANIHNKKSRETRTIEVDFQFTPRHAGYSRGSGLNSDDYEDSGTHRHRNKGDRYNNRRRQNEDSNMQRALDASLEDNAEAKTRAPIEERVPDPIHDFPTLGRTTVTSSAVTSSVVDSQRSTANSKPMDHFPSLGSSNGNGKKPQNPTSSSNKNYAAITHYTSEPRPVVKEKVKESQPVSLGTVKATNKDRWAMPTPKITDEDYPTLVGKNKPNARAIGASASTWLQKHTVSEEPAPMSVAPSFSIIKSKPTDIVSQPKVPTAMKPISDEKEFPSLGLGGGAARQDPVPMNISWLKPKSSGNSKPSQKPRSERVDDESFELPDSYYKSYELPVPHQAKDKSKEEKSSNSVSKNSVSMHKKDFPDLPKREIVDKQVKGDLKDVEPKVGVTVGKKSKKPKKGPRDKSLNDIAAGLIGESTTKSQVKEKKSNNNTDQNGNKPKSSRDMSKSKGSITDWFDNPPVVQENLKPQIESKKEAVPNSNNNFPSLHTMSSSVQKTTTMSSSVQKTTTMSSSMQKTNTMSSSVQKTNTMSSSVQKTNTMSSSVQKTNPPPGFMSNPLPIPSQSISAPPGFSKPAPPGLSKPIYSVHDYIQPADFTSRNQSLVRSIRSCLDTVANGFDKFKTLSFQFRQGEINANLYYSNCLLLMGETDFRKIFPELLALLPDINKQQELWFEHQVMSSGRSSSKQGENSKSMHPCAQCSQVILKDDLQHHNLQHGDGQDFPSLTDTTNNGASDYNANRPLKGAWIKAT